MLKFKKPRRKFKLNATPTEGLSGDKVLLRGSHKRGHDDSSGDGGDFSFLNMGGNDGPDDDEIGNIFAAAASGQDDDDVPFGVLRPTKKKKKSRSRKAPSTHIENHWADHDDDPEPYGDYTGPETNPFEPPMPPPAHMGLPPDLDDDSDSSDDEDSDDDEKSIVSGLSSVSKTYALDPALQALKDKRNGKRPEPIAEEPEPSHDNPLGLTRAEMEEAEKNDILQKFAVLKAGKTKFTKNYTAKSSLAELRLEAGRIEHEKEKEYNMLKLRRQMLVFCGGAEKAVGAKVMPKAIRGKLNGFSTYTLNNFSEYDPVFERMSEKYGGSLLGGGSSGNPMVDLFLVMASQMFMFFFMQHSSTPHEPTEEEIRKNYPSLVKRLAAEEAERIRESEVRAARERIAAEQQQGYYGQQQQPSYQTPGYQGIYGGGMTAPPTAPPAYAPTPIPRMPAPPADAYDLHGSAPAPGIAGGHAPFQEKLAAAPKPPKKPVVTRAPVKAPALTLASIDASGFSSAPLPDQVVSLPKRPTDTVKVIGGGDSTGLEENMGRLKIK